MLDYLAMPDEPSGHADGAIVFCRADPLITDLAERLLDLIEGYVLLTGGIGKDSGALAEQGIPEAVFHAERLDQRGADMARVVVEPTASNGYENSMFAMDLIERMALPHGHIVLAGHPTSLRRLSANHRANAAARGFVAEYSWASTSYCADPSKPIDRKEAADEIVRLSTWPDAFGWALRPEPVPESLVATARQISTLA